MLSPSPPPQLSSLAVRISDNIAVHGGGLGTRLLDNSCGGGLGTRLLDDSCGGGLGMRLLDDSCGGGLGT